MPWQRRGFRVLKRFDKGDDSWIGCDGNLKEWAVVYHGFRCPDFVL